MVFISHGQDVLWSQKVCWKCIFQGSGDPNVKISPFTAHHGGTSGDTDLANSKETQSLRKNSCRQKCLEICMAISLREMWSNLSSKDAGSSTEG